MWHLLHVCPFQIYGSFICGSPLGFFFFYYVKGLKKKTFFPDPFQGSDTVTTVQFVITSKAFIFCDFGL